MGYSVEHHSLPEGACWELYFIAVTGACCTLYYYEDELPTTGKSWWLMEQGNLRKGKYSRIHFESNWTWIYIDITFEPVASLNDQKKVLQKIFDNELYALPPTDIKAKDWLG